MLLGPILPGRIPGALVADRLTTNLQDAQRSLLQLQEQISTGQRFQLPSEAPSAARLTISIQSLMERKTQALANVKGDTSLLSATDGALATFGNALNTAKGLVLSGIGSSASAGEKEGLATQVDSLIQQVLNAANSQFGGRYLFSGSNAREAPFAVQADGSVRYNGDQFSVLSRIDIGSQLQNNVDGQTALKGLTTPVTQDVNPALTLNTRISDLNRGAGAPLGQIVVTLQNGAATQTANVDLTGAETLDDIKTRLEDAFAGGPVTLAVSIDPTSKNGLRLTPSAGTVAVANVAGSRTASDLGIASAATAVLTGQDIDPRISLQTRLSDLNGGAGITATAAGGLRIVNGNQTQVVDVSSAQTVEELFNILRQADPNLSLGLNSAGNGLAISSRLSGADFSIGESGESTATDLGIRTFSASTRLSTLNLGAGVPVDAGVPLKITRRDGTTANIDLAGKQTIQDVLNAINAVDPGHLVASLNSVGNGISLLDDSGTGPLSVEASPVGIALGLNGTDSTTNPANPLVGRDPNPQSTGGTFDILQRLQKALRAGDDRELERLSGLIDKELTSVNQTRGAVGGRLKTLDDVDNRLNDELLGLTQSLSDNFDTDVTEAITQLSNRQITFEATLKISAQTMQLSLLTYI